ncbi:uncharacterized protein [Epargyreus clarus]|uniref:uncharacterized protein n=1 Tax=Epargyreus clarus TaxID=520877 RepID=UPI003C2FF15B
MSQERIQTTAEQDRCLSTLHDIANIIQKTQINLKKCPKQRLTKGYVQARLKSLEDYWSTFKQAHNNLTLCTPREQKGMLPYFLNEDFYQVEDLYLVLQADLTDHLLKLESTNTSNTSTVSNDTQPLAASPLATLPRIQLPVFSGKYEDWPSYQDLFTALVHNTNLSNVQKLHYLKTSVSGEAEMLLRHIQILDYNYLQAWELLKGRFGNKKMILNAILKRLFGQKRVTNQTSIQIKNILDTTAECINNLINLKINTDSWDPIIIFLVSQKLDPESLKDWEEFIYKNQSDELPTWDMLKGFLEAKFRTLELVAPTSVYTRDKIQTQKLFHTTTETGKHHAAVTTQHTCSYCQNNHHIFQCKDFSKLPVEQRQDFVKTQRLCYNCLIPNHNAFKCKQTTSCRICKRKHHSLLHHSRDVKETSQPAVSIEPCITTAHVSHNPGHQVLLATAQVEVSSSYGHKHLLRALIDQGSEASFVSARVVDLLGLSKTNIDGIVSGVGEGSRISIKHCVDLTITSRFNANDGIPVKAYVLKTISSSYPRNTSRRIYSFKLYHWLTLHTIHRVR